MPRYKLTIEYDGTSLVGWQRQPNGLSVQEVLETAVERLCGEAARVYGAGRTDSGVHAMGQVAQVDLTKAMDHEIIRSGLNFHLRPAAVSVLMVEEVPDDWEARFSAKGRAYLYRILNRRAPPMLLANRVWHVGTPLDADAMQEAAQMLLGKHDFTTFRDSLCQAKSPIRTLDRLDVTREGEEIRIVAEARSFLHHQVRNMTGTLKLVGSGKWTKAQLQEAFEARDRTRGGPTAPPDGLYLTSVRY